MSNMQTRPSSSSGESLPDYAAFDGTAPPAYSLDEYPNSPARPKAAHTHSSRDKATVPTPNPPLVNDHIHMQNGLNFDVEANIAAANTTQMAPRTRNNQNRNSNNTVRVRPTHFDSFTNFILFISLFIWAANVSMEATGDLCHSLTNQVIFCGLPPTAVFFLWIATFQEKGIWATSRNGKTEKQYNRVRVMCQWAVFLFIPLTIVILTQAMFMLCRDGCANGVGDGEYCINN